MARFARGGIALAMVAVVSWFTACSDNPGDPSSLAAPLPDGVTVSNPVPATALGAGAPAAVALASGAATDVVYVSLVPGTVPAGTKAVVRRVGDAASLTTAVAGGGFDPVPVVAQAGDSIEVTVTGADSATLFKVRVAVAAIRPPIVVRTEPPPRKRDVPLNAALAIVFSEPVSSGTLTSSSVQLLKGTTPVAGTVRLLQGTATTAVFAPAAALDANTEYRLTVTRAVRDLQGDQLVAPDTVDFTTGAILVGPVAWVSLGLPADTPATVVSLGSRFQLIATARDAQGIEVVGQPVAWSSDNPSVVTVSATGLVTALAEGMGAVTATVDGQSGQALFAVTTNAVGTVTVTPKSTQVAMGGAVQLRAEVLDLSGQRIDRRLVTWSSSDPAVATVAPSQSSDPVMVTGMAAGIARISATVDGKSDTAIVTVSTVASGGRIAFASSGDIWVMNADGSGAVPIYTWGGAGGPAWSPDGRRIAFGGHGISVMNADGSQVTCLTCGLSMNNDLSGPAWSGDGTKMAATRRYDTCTQHEPRGGSCIRWAHHYDIVVMNTAGEVVTGGVAGGREPAWSPDGRIAFTGVPEGIFVMNADGSGVTNLTASGTSPAWSPDGIKIVFRDNRTGVLGLYVMNADGSEVRALTADSGYGRPAWSPDGKRIAFASGRDGTGYSKIYVMNADGSGVVRLTDNIGVDPAWAR